MRITRLQQSISDEEQKPVSPSLVVSLRRDLHSKCLFLTLLISASISAVVWCKLSVRRPDRLSQASLPISPTGYPSTPTRAPTTTTTTSTPVPQQPAWPCDGSYIYIPASLLVMLYLVYLVECWHCHTRLDLRCRADVNTVYQRIAAFRQAPPVVWWKIVCYHYVRRARHMTRYRNGEAYTAAHAYYERVNSRCVTSAFNYSAVGVVDRSKKLIDLEKYPATRVYVTKGFSFASIEAEREFVQQRSSFFQDYHHRDDYIEFREGIDLVNVNYRSQMTAFSSTDRFPWYVSKVSFWLASFLLLSWPLRVLIQYKTAIVHYHIHKVFGYGCASHGGVPAAPPGSQTALSRASTLDNYDLEKTILRNNSIVPSYSEALLMESEMRCQQQPHQQHPRDRSLLYGTAVRISASSTLLASGWRGQYLINPEGSYGSLNGDYVHRISATWTTASLQRSRTGNPGAEIAPAHAQSCSNAMATSSRRLSWFENGTRERNRRDQRTKATRQEIPQRRPLADEEDRGLEMTSLPSTIAAVADNPSSNETSSTMQEIQPWGPQVSAATSVVVSSNPAFRGTTSSSSSSSSQLSSSTSSSSPSSSAESLPSYETALGMAVISDREHLLPSSTRRGCTSVSMTTGATAAVAASSSRKRLTSSSRDDSRDDTDSVETTSTYVSDHTDTPRHQVASGSNRATVCPASSSTRLQSALSPAGTPSQRPPSKCRVIEDRETSL